ncbi:hypothetical protein KY289_017032 [Solanum tuberosum]|nr:hypothetical protein KY284_016827 [Solanum tuberosum]KAH0689674.1 hypothetical protein KY289_017032 [Solanum tuberosum]
MSGGTHSENMTNSLRHSGEPRQPDLVESVVEVSDLTILSPRLAQVIDATVTNGTVLDSPRIEVEVKPIDEPIEDPPASNWTNLFAKNRAATNGLNLEYIPPKMVDGKQIVELAQEEIDKELYKWNCSLIAYFIRETPGYKSMQRYMMQFWANVVQPDHTCMKWGIT